MYIQRPIVIDIRSLKLTDMFFHAKAYKAKNFEAVFKNLMSQNWQ